MIKKIIRKLISAGIVSVVLFAGVASAQTTDLPDPGMLPNSPFYFVKSFFEDVGTFFTFGNSAKAERYLALAEKRLAEAKVLAEQEDEEAQDAIARYEDQYAEAKERAERADNLDLEAQVTDATTKHLSVLDEVLARVPEQAKESIRAAKERSVAGQIEALRGIAQRNPEAAVDIFARAAEGRLNAANARAGRGGDDDEAKEVEEALEDYDKYAQFGKEISTMAGGIRTGETAVEDLVKKATSHHLQVLEDVHQKLPPQAQQEFQRALDNARKVQELRPAIPAPTQPGVQQRQPTRPGISQIPVRPQTQQQPTQPGIPQVPAHPQTQPEVERETEVEQGAPQQIPGGPPRQTPGGRP
jgi:tetratricopeptide (TPR) repeat protein